MTTALGCDSLVTLQLTVSPTTFTSLNETICQGSSYLFNGNPLTAAGVYTQNFIATNGCDSTVILNLTTAPTITNQIQETICQGAIYSFDGTDLNTPGVYTATFSTNTGCDSVVTLNLTVSSAITSTLSESICQGASYSFNGNVITTSGIYTGNFITSTGCDSLVTLNLSVVPVLTNDISASICQGASYTFDGNDLTTTGVYTCLLYTSPSPRDRTRSRMPSSA